MGNPSGVMARRAPDSVVQTKMRTPPFCHPSDWFRRLMRAQISRRGGHMSRRRIAPGGIDGYIEALIESKAAKPDKHPIGEQRKTLDEKDATDGDGRCLHYAIGPRSLDLVNTDLADVERELDGIFYATDEWVRGYDPAQCVTWRNVAKSTLGQKRLQEWRDIQSPPQTHSKEPISAQLGRFAGRIARRTFCV